MEPMSNNDFGLDNILHLAPTAVIDFVQTCMENLLPGDLEARHEKYHCFNFPSPMSEFEGNRLVQFQLLEPEGHQSNL